MLEGKPPTTGPKDMAVNPADYNELRQRLKILTALTDHLRAVRHQVRHSYTRASAVCAQESHKHALLPC